MAHINQCTFAVTGKNYQEQYWRTCYDCFHNASEGVCLNCAALCHDGHHLGPLRSGIFFCDCGDQRKCKIGQFSKSNHAYPNLPLPEQTTVYPTVIGQPVNILTEKLFNQTSIDRVFSPLSIAYALSLVHLGAGGNTNSELTQLFGNKYTLDTLKQMYKLFNNNVVKMTNCLAVNQHQQVNPEYLQMLDSIALVMNVQFNDDLVKTLNAYIEQNTKGLIKDVIKKVNPSDLAILINTVYFKAKWLNPFDKYFTKKADFTNALTTTQVDMMYQKKKIPYYEDSAIQLIELLYVGNEFCFGVLLPKQVGIVPILDINQLGIVIQSLKSEDVRLSLPKFTHRRNVNLIPLLQQSGVNDLFTYTANLDKIAQGTFISTAIHEAVVIVDEEGTEAAATTVMMMSKGLVMTKDFVFNANHSFIYYIRHNPTNTVLFVGDYHGN